tara:strand:- start:361 stop:894 length:534 start_codon:yes stop_codon:yes gene_type:complete
MALANKKYERIYSKTGSDADLISASDFDDMKEDFDNNHYLNDVGQRKILGPVLYQLQQMQDELDALRTEISSNKSKATFPGFGTSSNTALAGDTTTISVSEQRAIALNTAKTTFPGFGTSNSTALVGDTNIVTIGSNTTIAFGDMITTQPKKGKPTYSIVMTVTNGGVSKAITLTLA